MMKSIDEQILDLMRSRPSFDEIVANSKRIMMTPYGLQDGNGVDVTLIQSALRMSPDERIAHALRSTQGMIRDRLNARQR